MFPSHHLPKHSFFLFPHFSSPPVASSGYEGKQINIYTLSAYILAPKSLHLELSEWSMWRRPIWDRQTERHLKLLSLQTFTPSPPRIPFSPSVSPKNFISSMRVSAWVWTREYNCCFFVSTCMCECGCACVAEWYILHMCARVWTFACVCLSRVVSARSLPPHLL